MCHLELGFIVLSSYILIILFGTQLLQDFT